MISRGIELRTSRTEGRPLTNCAILAPMSLGLVLQTSIGSFENEALENEGRSTKHPNLENKAPKSRKRSTQNSKTEHPNLENEARKNRKRSTQNSKPVRPFKTRDSRLSSHQQQESSPITNRMQFKTIQVELRGVANAFPSP